MSTRAVEGILAEWRALEREQIKAADADAEDAIQARIEQLRREYREVTAQAEPPAELGDATPPVAAAAAPLPDETPAPEQLRLPM
jgi:hypothetical protein